ncbi:general secretion pathway protein E [Ectothiorhodospira magna]|uniref:General secretion pathway protein E n=1 Tax=Ectothiorhodospira magna TaxID=867345 RepID=A0A1H9BK62_9GAMM|nr:ATPase, T2SS/T4P/T4SS family [Ectothiorhodospira magna]SEP88678.1 general secretion pathway protein E [Ectothiorhodospira magna]
MNRTPLGERLVAAGHLSSRDLEKALFAQGEMGGLLGQVLIRLGLCAELDVARVLAAQLEVPLVTAADYPEAFPALEGVALDFLQSHRVLPLTVTDHTARCALAVPQDAYVLKALALASRKTIQPVLGLESEIMTGLERLQAGPEEDSLLPEDLAAADADSEFVEHLRDLASEAPVIRIVNTLVADAIDLNASDVHLEPFEGVLHLRYRVDGVLQAAESPPFGLSAAITSRIKLLARLNIAERRLPQDGRIRMRLKGRDLDLRVSTVPTVHGESVVMRVLDKGNVRLSLDTMGFDDDLLGQYAQLLDRPHGILLVTGPTGSGKTTTQYASLNRLDADHRKIITVEDPVEYQLPGINQIQVKSQIGLTFANALRAILRQDPDIIMIGEMRDTETAQIAVQSALTGHLVLSTLHTNTATGAIIRLEDMGVERYLITSSVIGVLGQRLVRTLCAHCRQPATVTAALKQSTPALGRFCRPGDTIYRANGCDHCRHTGYSGRTAIHELLVMTDPLHRAILAGADATHLQQEACAQGMTTLFEDGLRKVAQGITSLDEVMRVAQETDSA